MRKTQKTMGKVILDMAMSLDGVVIDRKGNSLYPIDKITGTGTLNELIKNAGSVVMDFTAYEEAKSDFTNYEYQLPIFVLSDKKPEKIAKGENENLKFTFITDGIKSAISKAKSAAGDKNVKVIGWVNIAHELLKNKLLDEVIVRLIPLIVGKGEKLFEDCGPEEIVFEKIQVNAFPDRTDIKLHIIK